LEFGHDLVAGIFFQFDAPDERSELLERIKHCLKPGGLLIIQGSGKISAPSKRAGPES
jgi:hypothetical protein